jgi:5-methyltetrahydrofolate--homocysteine methyltransferase
MSVLNDLRQSVIDGDASSAPSLVKQAMEAGLPPEQILNEGLISAMAQVGKLFEEGEFFVPEMLIAARAMKAGLGLLRPSLAAANVKAVGKVVLGTVQGDLHDIGKNLVAIMLEGAGFEIVDLGTDVPPQKFADAVKQHQPQIVGLSALLTTTMPKMKDTIQTLKQVGVRDQVKVMIGGAPVTDKYASDIGADLYAPDASSAATRAKQLLR